MAGGASSDMRILIYAYKRKRRANAASGAGYSTARHVCFALDLVDDAALIAEYDALGALQAEHLLAAEAPLHA
jgi:hypothetical protein